MIVGVLIVWILKPSLKIYHPLRNHFLKTASTSKNHLFLDKCTRTVQAQRGRSIERGPSSWPLWCTSNNDADADEQEDEDVTMIILSDQPGQQVEHGHPAWAKRGTEKPSKLWSTLEQVVNSHSLNKASSKQNEGTSVDRPSFCSFRLTWTALPHCKTLSRDPHGLRPFLLLESPCPMVCWYMADYRCVSWLIRWLVTFSDFYCVTFQKLENINTLISLDWPNSARKLVQVGSQQIDGGPNSARK